MGGGGVRVGSGREGTCSRVHPLHFLCPPVQVNDEIHSGALFACLKFSLDGSLLLAVAEGRIYLLDSFEGELKQKVRGAAGWGSGVS